MGQKPSHQLGGNVKNKLPSSLFQRWGHTTRDPRPEQPIKFQYKTKKKNNNNNANNNNNSSNNNNEAGQDGRCGDYKYPSIHVNTLNKKVNNQSKTTNCRVAKTHNVPVRTKSEPNLVPERYKERHRRKRKNSKSKNQWNDEVQQFGYEIQDVDDFLTKATIEKPANIPVVLAFPSVLYQTRVGGYQAEISLPLGMVVNAVFKNKHWLYVQTPHAEEGYVSYAACLPLGIIPPPEDDKPTPCWEKSSDVFPPPSGNMTDTEKLSSRSDCGGTAGRRCTRSRSQKTDSTCGERSVDRLYLQAAAAVAKTKGIRQTLLVINRDFVGNGNNNISVKAGEVVSLLSADVEGWFYVRGKGGPEGYIPAAVAGHGFL